MGLEWYSVPLARDKHVGGFNPKIPPNFSGLPPWLPRQTRPLFKIPLSRTASEAILVGRVGFEPTVFTQRDRFYRPVQNQTIPAVNPYLFLPQYVSV